MNPAAFSVFAFGVYLAAGGLLLLLAPSELCDLLGLRPPGETMWVRLSGMFFLDLAFYCIRAARENRTEFIRWTVFTRPWTLAFLAAFVVFGLENPAILIFGIVDVVAAAWTAVALRRGGWGRSNQGGTSLFSRSSYHRTAAPSEPHDAPGSGPRTAGAWRENLPRRIVK